jgi:hypothetical protein
MTRSLVLGAAEASRADADRHQNLLNSQYREVRVTRDAVVGRAGYTAEYAEHVHDPDVKQTFRRSTAEKEFLRKGFERAEPAIRGALAGAMRT